MVVIEKLALDHCAFRVREGPATHNEKVKVKVVRMVFGAIRCQLRIACALVVLLCETRMAVFPLDIVSSAGTRSNRVSVTNNVRRSWIFVRNGFMELGAKFAGQCRHKVESGIIK